MRRYPKRGQLIRAAAASPGVCIPPVLMADPGIPIVSTGDEKDHGRLALRAATRFFLKSVDLLARAVSDGDILRGVIFLAVVDANTRHLRPADPVARSFADSKDQLPDEMRRPVSVHALALDLALPYETTRRHVNALIEQGLCQRVEAGILVRAEVLDREGMVATHRKNIENLRTLFRDLRDGGVDLET